MRTAHVGSAVAQPQLERDQHVVHSTDSCTRRRTSGASPRGRTFDGCSWSTEAPGLVRRPRAHAHRWVLRGAGFSARSSTDCRRVGQNWLRVFRSAEASRVGQGGRQQRHTRAVRSEKWGNSVAERGTGMRVIAAFFSPCAPDAPTSHVSVFVPLFQEVRPICKTRNQFTATNPDKLSDLDKLSEFGDSMT
jgi:hypothetical protein